MFVIEGRNVNDVYAKGMALLYTKGVKSNSRAGEVLVLPAPVVSVYQQPHERVLFDAKRDANPFFHLFEAMWMLAGRDDAAPLSEYVRDFGERFADDNGVIHDAYGWRWRHSTGVDQIAAIVKRLRRDPLDRQCVLQMWDATTEGESDLTGDWRTRPCNTHIYFRLHGGRLDMTVCCRSNDAVWGAYGANAVHFSFLQSYVAGMLDVRVGTMYQISNNMHGYIATMPRSVDTEPDPYGMNQVVSMPLGNSWHKWDHDLANFMVWHDDDRPESVPLFFNEWFYATVCPMLRAHRVWRYDRRAALGIMAKCQSPDWRRAGIQWMERRL